MKKLTILFLFLIVNSSIKAQKYFICFVDENNPKIQISVCFDKNDRAQYVKYKGQDETIPLFYSKIERVANPGGHPEVYGFTTYNEKYRGKTTGKYIFSNMGGMSLTYRRARDGKEFNFVLLDNSNGSGNTIDRSTPCF